MAKYTEQAKLVEQWVKMYQLHGTEGLSEFHKRFSGEFKIYVVEYMRRNHLKHVPERRLQFDREFTKIYLKTSVYSRFGGLSN